MLVYRSVYHLESRWHNYQKVEILYFQVVYVPLENKLVGGWTNPFEKYAVPSKWVKIFPKFRDEH